MGAGAPAAGEVPARPQGRVDWTKRDPGPSAREPEEECTARPMAPFASWMAAERIRSCAAPDSQGSARERPGRSLRRTRTKRRSRTQIDMELPIKPKQSFTRAGQDHSFARRPWARQASANDMLRPLDPTNRPSDCEKRRHGQTSRALPAHADERCSSTIQSRPSKRGGSEARAADTLAHAVRDVTGGMPSRESPGAQGARMSSNAKRPTGSGKTIEESETSRRTPTTYMRALN